MHILNAHINDRASTKNISWQSSTFNSSQLAKAEHYLLKAHEKGKLNLNKLYSDGDFLFIKDEGMQ